MRRWQRCPTPASRDSRRGWSHESDRVDNRLDDLVKVLIGGFIGFTGAVMAGFGALVVLFATEL